jgi:FAD/FMN-containing dehydrogenase
MPERDPAERLDKLVDAMLSGIAPSSDSAAPLGDLLAVAGALRGLPNEEFRARLNAELVKAPTPKGADMTTTTTPIHTSHLVDLAGRFSGQLLQPGDREYDEARRVHNGLVDKRPALIARCRGTADIVAAVNLARTLRLEVAIRGGGHNVAGRATVDDGLMIDLSPMKGIHVDPETRTARAQGGVTWAEYNRETQAHGLAGTGGVVSSTGIAGLTLGGGLGWLLGRYGLAVDNLLSVQLVTADGRILTASEHEHPDLFWGLCGGGGNFGVAASFAYRVHAVGPTITGGLVAHPFPRARDVLRFYRDVSASAPDELTAFAGLLHAPDGSNASIAAIVTCHCGTLEHGESAVRPIKAFGPPVMDTLGPMPYCEMNSMLDAGYPKGALNYWKSNFLAALSDDAIDTMIDCYARCPSPMSQLLLEHFHGAAVRVGAHATAFPHRTAGYNFLVLGQWMDPAEGERCLTWVRETFAAMQPYMAPGRYVNYLGDDEGDRVAAAYGPNYVRLQQLKAKYDPDNFFHMNQNIRLAR